MFQTLNPWKCLPERKNEVKEDERGLQKDIYWSIEVISCEFQATLSGPHIVFDHQWIRISVGRLPRKESCHKKGAGVRNQLQFIWFVGLQSRILCAFHHLFFCFYRPLLNACVILVKHTSRLQFRCVHTFQKARCAQFSLQECRRTLLICVKSSFRIKIDAAGCHQMDFKLRCRFHWLWYLNSFEVCVAQRVVGLIYCCSNFLLPHNPIADQFSYLLFVFVLVCVSGCVNICTCI